MSNELQTILVLLPILFGLIALVQSYRANKFARSLAIAQGAFRRAELSFGLFGTDTIQHFYIGLPFPPQTVIEVPMPYRIANIGQRSFGRVELFLRMSKDLHYGGYGRQEFRGSSIKNTKFELVSERENIHTFGYFIDSLLPKQAISLTDVVSLRSATSIKSTVSVPTKDGVLVDFNYAVEFAYTISAVVMLDDSEPLTRTFALTVFDTSTMSAKEYLAKRNKDIQESKSRTKPRSFAHLRSLLFRRHRSSPPTRIHIMWCELDDLQRDAKRPICRVKELKGFDGLENQNGFVVPGLQLF